MTSFKKTRLHSHLGCRSCRRRKCDELKPSCRRCFNRNERCSYLDCFDGSLKASSLSPASNHAVSTHDVGERHNFWITSSNQFSLMDLELTHHFLTMTSRTMWHRAKGQEIWGDVIFRAGLQHPPVLNGILATAAAHKVTLLANNASRTRYIAFALMKRAEAFNGLVALLRTPVKENAVAIFALSAMINTWTFASRALPEALDMLCQGDVRLGSPTASLPGQHGSLDQFIELASKASIVNAAVRQTSPWLTGTSLEEMSTLPYLEPQPRIPFHAEKALQRLELYSKQDATIRMMLESSSTLIPLRALLHTLVAPANFNALVIWPFVLPQAFTRALVVREPGALTILAYWAACLRSFDCWWTKGWGSALLAEICASTDDSWSPLLDWPRNTGLIKIPTMV